MTWKTVKEWNAEGKNVIKGQKCVLRDPVGNCLFSEGQVEKTERKYYRSGHCDYIPTRNGYYAQKGGNYQKYDYDYDAFGDWSY